MITTNENAGELDPKVTNSPNEDKKHDDKESDDQSKDDDDDDEVGYEILPSNDSGITADDNAATGELHQREGD